MFFSFSIFHFSRSPLKLLAFFAQFFSRSPSQNERRKTASKLLNNGHHPKLNAEKRRRKCNFLVIYYLQGKYQYVCLIMFTIPKYVFKSCLISWFPFSPAVRPADLSGHRPVNTHFSCLISRFFVFAGFPAGQPLIRGRR